MRDDLRYAPGQCDEVGALFRIVAVERYSTRLLEHLAKLYSDGIFATSEAFASSACALAAAKGEWPCRLGDWAHTPRADDATRRPSPDASRAVAGENHTSWRTVPGILPAQNYRGPHYYFYPARFGYIESFCVSSSPRRGSNPTSCLLPPLLLSTES